MRIGRLEWSETPLVVIPIASACFAVPILIGLSDRAAEFAGGFASAIAAVIAVILTGQIQRSNDRARAERDHAADVSAEVREMTIFIGMQADGFATWSTFFERQLEEFEESPDDVRLHNAVRDWVALMESVSEESPNRFLEGALRIDDLVARALIAYSGAWQFLKKFCKSATRADNETLPLVRLRLLLSTFQRADSAAQQAKSALDAFRLRNEMT